MYNYDLDLLMIAFENGWTKEEIDRYYKKRVEMNAVKAEEFLRKEGLL